MGSTGEPPIRTLLRFVGAPVSNINLSACGVPCMLVACSASEEPRACSPSRCPGPPSSAWASEYSVIDDEAGPGSRMCSSGPASNIRETAGNESDQDLAVQMTTRGDPFDPEVVVTQAAPVSRGAEKMASRARTSGRASQRESVMSGTRPAARSERSRSRRRSLSLRTVVIAFTMRVQCWAGDRKHR